MKNNSIKKEINNIFSDIFNDKIDLIDKNVLNWNIERVIDSFAVLEIIMHIEEKFNISINLDKISNEDISCTNNILKLINKNKK